MTARPLLTAADVRALLTGHRLAPRKAHGQNFVVDPNTVRKVVRDAGVAAGDLVVEVGPGLGSLTLALLEAGAQVVAVEIDAGFAALLPEVVGPDVTVLHADALAVDHADLVGGATGAVRLVANLPYNVATAIALRALEAGVYDTVFVMVQREVGSRWAAQPRDDDYAGVSVKLAALAEVRIAGTVSRRAFYPVPGVDSVTVALTPKSWDSPVPRDTLFTLVDRGFAQRRKRLRNALAQPGSHGERHGATPRHRRGEGQAGGQAGPAGGRSRLGYLGEFAPGEIEAALATAGLDPGARAEELDLAGWSRLAASLLAPGPA